MRASYREEWVGKISEPGVHRRAELYYQQLDFLRLLRQEARRDLLLEANKHKPWNGADPDAAPLPHQATAVDFS